ncbi:arylalkylamine N-acetyltransferase 1-like [Condylostylus longicornis]|uniref:arylalkylamine N-acetyltransferase 1-like n=1 Tax=Condylostylus longicornis TaxID=2530218 RepID=UPI00244DD80F|nr:arylalkylamine N-acetyltransferase 1-like [Condylostylus longicornis]
MSQKPKFTIEVVKPEDKKEFYEVMREFFIKDEPVTKSLGIMDINELKFYLTKNISENCCFKAIDENGKIIGAVANGIERRQDLNDIKNNNEEEEEIIDERWKKLCMLFDNVDKNYNIFKIYPNINIYLAGKAIAVNPKYRGLGIAGELINKTVEFMKQNNINLMIRTCTSAFSARVMEKSNMKEVYKINYKDFIVNGEQLLKPESPHTACKVFILDIEN